MLSRSQFLRFARVGVIGGGTMGGGIAQVTAQAGIPVILRDVSNERIDAARSAITTSLSRVISKQHPTDPAKAKSEVDSIMAQITFTTQLKGVADSKPDVIIEAIAEDITAKKSLWAELDAITDATTVFCTNTSSLSVAAQAAATKRLDRFAGLHFFSPVPLMKLVEVVKTDALSPSVLSDLLTFSKRIGKTPITVSDTKGFVVNRLLVPLLLEAARLVERGVATKEDVDTAMRLGAGHPMGPFTLMDSIGLDVIDSITKAWSAEEPTEKLFVPSPVIEAQVKAGKLGRKTKEGFYKY